MTSTKEHSLPSPSTSPSHASKQPKHEPPHAREEEGRAIKMRRLSPDTTSKPTSMTSQRFILNGTKMLVHQPSSSTPSSLPLALKPNNTNQLIIQSNQINIKPQKSILITSSMTINNKITKSASFPPCNKENANPQDLSSKRCHRQVYIEGHLYRLDII